MGAIFYVVMAVSFMLMLRSALVVGASIVAAGVGLALLLWQRRRPRGFVPELYITTWRELYYKRCSEAAGADFGPGDDPDTLVERGVLPFVVRASIRPRQVYAQMLRDPSIRWHPVRRAAVERLVDSGLSPPGVDRHLHV